MHLVFLDYARVLYENGMVEYKTLVILAMALMDGVHATQDVRYLLGAKQMIGVICARGAAVGSQEREWIDSLACDLSDAMQAYQFRVIERSRQGHGRFR